MNTTTPLAAPTRALHRYRVTAAIVIGVAVIVRRAHDRWTPQSQWVGEDSWGLWPLTDDVPVRQPAESRS